MTPPPRHFRPVEIPESHDCTPILNPPVAAIGYSLVYVLFGGGLLGAIVIFLVAKMFRK
jgi:hypothetical protein